MDYYDTYLEFVQNYEELVSKWKNQNNQNDPRIIEKTQKFAIINQQIESLNREIESFLVNIDQEKFQLSKSEQQRIEDMMTIDRVIDKLKPIFTLGMISEWNDEQLDHRVTLQNQISFPNHT